MSGPADWLPKLPAHWRRGQLRWLSRIYSGGTPARDNLAYWIDGDVPWLASGAVNQWDITEPSEYITELAVRESSTRWVPAGTVVMGLAGQGKTKGLVARTSIRATCNQSLCAIAPRGQLDYRFLHFWLSVNHENLRNLAGGDKRDGLNHQLVGQVVVPLASLPEQRAIADFLDRETARIDVLIEKQTTMISLLKERRISAIVRATTVGLGDQNLADSGIYWATRSPLTWSSSPLKRLLQSVQSGVWGGDADGGTDDISCVRVTDFDRLHLSVADAPTIRSINQFDRSKCRLHRGDLLIEKSGGTSINPVGFVVAYESDDASVYANFIARLRVHGHHAPRYWLYALNGSYGSGLTWKSVKQTTGIQNLDMDAFLAEWFPVPPLEEQHEIAGFLDRETAKIDNLIAKTERMIELSRERRSALITAAVTGQIDVSKEG